MPITTETPPVSHHYIISADENLGLSDLMQKPRTEALKALENASPQEKWDQLLTGQTRLFAPQDIEWLKTQPWWAEAHTVLDIGSGNGKYLKEIIRAFPHKSYTSIEKDEEYVLQCQQSGITCTRGNIETYASEKKHDLIILRLVLQHLTDPYAAIENAKNHLKPGGRLLIIDAYDSITSSSYESTIVTEVKSFLIDEMKNENKDRSISKEIQKKIENHSIEGLKVLLSNVDLSGGLTGYLPRFEGDEERKICAQNLLLITSIAKHKYGGDFIDLGSLWDDLESHVQNNNSYWSQIGSHYLVLEKV